MDDVNFYLTKQLDLGGITKYSFIVYKEDALKLITSIHTNRSIFDIRFVGENAYNTFRIESGIPGYPNEINDSFNPHELNLMDEVNSSKGCYIGQEVIARLDTYDKVQRKLMAVAFNENGKIELPGTLINSKENEAGEITSITHSKILDKNIGLALVRNEYTKEGTILSIVDKNSPSQVSVISLPIMK